MRNVLHPVRAEPFRRRTDVDAPPCAPSRDAGRFRLPPRHVHATHAEGGR